MTQENYNYDDENIEQKNQEDFQEEDTNEEFENQEDESLNINKKDEFSQSRNDIDEEKEKLKAENIKLQQIIKRKKKQGKWDDNTGEDEKGEEKLQTTDSRTESYLFSKGLEIEDVDYLNKIAKIENISLLDAYKSDYFNIYKDKQEKEKQMKQASLAGGQRQGQNRKRNISDYDISEEDHKAMFKKHNN